MSPDQHVGAEPLHARGPRAAEQEHALIGAVGGLALGEGLVAEAIVDVVQERAVAAVQGGLGRRSLAAVEPPAGDPEPDELDDGPTTTRRATAGIGEVDVALPLAIVRARRRSPRS